MDTRLSLSINTVLDGSYRITRVVGAGGFGITYEAEDLNLGTIVAVKEYYPFDFGDRDSTMSVRPKSERHRQTFDWGRSNFLREARTLARFEHPAIVRVVRVFETNSTAYMVMRFERGSSFEDWLKGLGRLPTQEELDAIVAPLLDALELMHAADFLHRDIAPDNIIVRADGSPVLLDFGAARRAVAEISRTMTGIVKAGYSPHEQYSSDSRLQGPWSDLYAFGGVLYRATTGRAPEEATLRVDEDRMPPAFQAARKGRFRPGFLAAIDHCLKVKHDERPRSVAELRPRLLGVGALSVSRRLFGGIRPQSKPRQLPNASKNPQAGSTVRQVPSKTGRLAIAASVVALLGSTYGGYEYTRWQTRAGIGTSRQADDEATRRRHEAQFAQDSDRREAETKVATDASARAARKGEEEARARTEERASTEQREAEERTRETPETPAKGRKAERVAAIEPGPTDGQAETTPLSSEERARYIQRVHEVLMAGRCTEGAGSETGSVQRGLDRFVDHAHAKGSRRPVRIDLARATASDFDSWLRAANGVKDDLCVAKPNLPARPRTVERTPSRAPAQEQEYERAPRERSYRARESYSSEGGGGDSSPIQGVR